MKKMICLLIALLLLCGCSAKKAAVFTESESGNIVSAAGVKYAFLANEGILYYLGETEFAGHVEGEKKISQHLLSTYKTGMFSIKNTENDNILIRRLPDNEWSAIYRKASLPEFDYSVENCIRLELVPGIGDLLKDAVHTSCGDGITDPAEIAAFLSEVRDQPSPRDAGLYDMIKNPNGMLENCYVYAVVYGFFEEESNIVTQMQIQSFNDLAYSITIEGQEYVLPEAWLQKLQKNSCK